MNSKSCSCVADLSSKRVLLIGLNGAVDEVDFLFCNCTLISRALMQKRYVPATPKLPRFAFSFGLLSNLSNIKYLSDVSTQALLKHINLPVIKNFVDSQTIYRGLKNSLHEFVSCKLQMERLFTENFDSLEDFNPFQCPACTNGQNVLRFCDGFMSAKRYSKSGSYGNPLIAGNLFQELDTRFESQATLRVNNDRCNKMAEKRLFSRVDKRCDVNGIFLVYVLMKFAMLYTI